MRLASYLHLPTVPSSANAAALVRVYVYVYVYEVKVLGEGEGEGYYRSHSLQWLAGVGEGEMAVYKRCNGLLPI